MPSAIAIILTLCLFADADVPMVYRLRARTQPPPELPAGQELPVLPRLTPGSDKPQIKKNTDAPKSARLRPETRLELVRYVSGEFAHAIKPLPGGKDGIVLQAGKPLNQQQLDRAVANKGAAVNTGDSAQITRLEFREHTIVVDVNGGGRGKKRWRDRIHLEMGGSMPRVNSSQQDSGPPGVQTGLGSTIFLDFGKPVPDLSPNELKQLLSPLLDFSKQRSASVQWIDTLPPEMKKAIKERHPAVGMDREMVVAAIGKPQRKVREKDQEGNEIEDWIYGTPPSQTMFVRFQGERVTMIKEFPH